MEKFGNLLEVKNYIHKKTGNQFSHGEHGYYLTYFENISEFLDAYDGRIDESLTNIENFIAISDQSDIQPVIPKSDFLIFDSMHFDDMTIIQTLDKYDIDCFIDDVKCYVK